MTTLDLDAVIVSFARTPIAKAYRGAFNDTQPQELAGYVIEHAVRRAGVDPARIDDVVLGFALQEGRAVSTPPASRPCGRACPRARPA